MPTAAEIPDPWRTLLFQGKIYGIESFEIKKRTKVFQIGTEELLAEFRSVTKKRVSAQRFEILASKIALLEDEEFEIVITLVDSFVSKAYAKQTSAES